MSNPTETSVTAFLDDARITGGDRSTVTRLIEEARGRDLGDARARRDAAYHLMQEMCGDRPGYEEALRLLYRGDDEGFAHIVEAWPPDLRAYLAKLLGT